MFLFHSQEVTSARFFKGLLVLNTLQMKSTYLLLHFFQRLRPCDWLQSNSICIPVFTQQSVTVYLTTFRRTEASQERKPQVNLQLIHKVLRTLRLPPAAHLSPSGLCSL